VSIVEDQKQAQNKDILKVTLLICKPRGEF
jgi:hypothetical protein